MGGAAGRHVPARRLGRAACAALLLSLGALRGAAEPARALGGEAAAAGPSWHARAEFVVDGDSLWVRPERGGRRARLRLQGIDAPELCQPGGASARAALQALVRGERLRVTVHARDRFGRRLASVQRQRDGLDVAAGMVAQGWAWNDRQGWRRGRYAREEAQARAARRGVFAAADAQSPADFRRRHGPCGTAQSGAASTSR